MTSKANAQPSSLTQGMNADKAKAPSGAVLGLNIGIGSIGWCLVDFDEERLIDMGVRLWDVPQAPKTKESLAAARRAYRGTRRNIARATDRRSRCLALLKDAGIVPADAGKGYLQLAKGDAHPVLTRAAALGSRVSDRALAQALYNICSRRGYISHAGGGGGADDGKVINALKENAEELERSGMRTWGELLASRAERSGGHVRSRNKGGDYSLCISAPLLIDEAKRIIAVQRELGNDKLTPEFEKGYLECLQWEKPRDAQDERIYDLVKQCIYFPEEKAAARACLSYEMCCAFEKVANVRVIGGDTPGVLPAEARRWCVETMFSPVAIKGNKSCKVTYKALRRHLALDEGAFFKGVDDESDEVYVPKVWRAERETLPKELLLRMRADRVLADAIGSALAFSSTEQSLRACLAPLDVDEAEVQSLLALNFAGTAYSGYGTRSVKALEMLVDAFEDVDGIESLAAAEEASGLKEVPGAQHARGCKLPPYPEYEPTCSNPVVLRAMAQLRRLVDAVIAEYGMPAHIRMDLGRELKRGAHEKKLINISNKARDKANKDASELAAKYLCCQPEAVPGRIVRKVRLYREQGGVDIYTGQKIDVARLVGDESYCQIGHILPLSRTFDDSQANEALAMTSTIQSKGSLSPYEWFSQGGNWKSFARRVKESETIPVKKKYKYLEENLEQRQEEFVERNLSDTRYATRTAKGYLSDLLDFGDDGRAEHVSAIAGAATAMLRREWGFSCKNREQDDVHSAVDAAILAACDRSVIYRVAKVSESEHLSALERHSAALAEKEPWPGFHDDVERAAARVIPTRRVEHGGTGQLYEDSTYGFIEMEESGKVARLKKGGELYRKSNFRKFEDGSVKLLGGHMMLRLWWDGKRYLKEPVFYADLAAMKDGTYVPRYHVTGAKATIRANWPAVPDEVVAAGPAVVLHRGDAVQVGDEVLRYKSFGLSNGSLRFSPMRCYAEMVNPLQGFSKAESPDFVKVLPEDVLGSCYEDARIEGDRVIM